MGTDLKETVWESVKLIYLGVEMVHQLVVINPLNAELNPICYLRALLGA
jgi:hypothetical protein